MVLVEVTPNAGRLRGVLSLIPSLTTKPPGPPISLNLILECAQWPVIPVSINTYISKETKLKGRSNGNGSNSRLWRLKYLIWAIRVDVVFLEIHGNRPSRAVCGAICQSRL